MPRADGEQPLLTENGSQIQGGGSEPFPVGRMFAILCFGFSFGELISNFGLIMLPAESGYMEPANNALVVGVVSLVLLLRCSSVVDEERSVEM